MLDRILDIIWPRSIELWITDQGYYIVSAPTGQLTTIPELAGLRPDRSVDTLWTEIREQSRLIYPSNMDATTAVWIDDAQRMWRATYMHALHTSIVLRRVGFPFTLDDYPEPLTRMLPSILENGTGLILFAGPVGGGKSALMSAFLRELMQYPIGISLYEDNLEMDLPEGAGVLFHRIRGVHYDDLATALDADRRVMIRVVAVQEITEPMLPLLLQQVRMGRLVLSTIHAVSLRELLFRLSVAVGNPVLLSDTLQALIMIRLYTHPTDGHIVPVPSVFRPLGSARAYLEQGDLDGAIQAHENDREGLENLPEPTVITYLEQTGRLPPQNTFATGRLYIQESAMRRRRVIAARLGTRFILKVHVTGSDIDILHIRPFRDAQAIRQVEQEARHWPPGIYEVELTE